MNKNKFINQLGGASRSQIESARDENDLDGIIRTSERKLLRTLLLVLGASWIVLFFCHLETTWYGWALLVALLGTSVTMLVRRIGKF